jgi:ABC-type lipoprotein export system ATPase subunit
MSDLIVEHLRKEYPTPTEPLVILRDVMLEMSLGQNLAIVGPSGSGKSTLLHIVGTLDRPTAGEVRLQGRRHSRYRNPTWPVFATSASASFFRTITCCRS